MKSISVPCAGAVQHGLVAVVGLLVAVVMIVSLSVLQRRPDLVLDSFRQSTALFAVEGLAPVHLAATTLGIRN